METIAKGMSCGRHGCSIADHAASQAKSGAQKGGAIRIEMFSDFICPWCLLGASELDDLAGKYEFTVEHRGIEIFPDIPKDGIRFEDSPMAAHMPAALLKIAKIRDLGISHPPVLPNTRNAILAEAYAKENKIPYVDYFSAMVTADGTAMKPELANDNPGVHPNAKGYAVMESLLLPVIKKLR